MKAWKIAALTILVIAVAAALGTVFIIQRGFRASSEPSHFEATIARAVRNTAIPRHERNAKNPMPSTPEVLDQGREAFLSRCAVCHGVDGSGRTDVGAGLYPRVPDLRSEKTPHLSDSQIHYIIENGVQLTGMPAWGNRHHASSDDSWKLTLFIRSLSPLTSTERDQQSAEISSAAYVGSRACEKCHAEVYARWKKTPMANVVRDPKAHPDAIVADLANNNIAKIDVNQVAFVYGSIWKQRYFTKIGDDYFPLSVQRDIGTHQWLKYFIPPTGADWWGQYYPADNMHALPAPPAMAATRSGTTFTPSRLPSGMSVANGVMGR